MVDRKIVLDTETTGLRISDGHRIIEIGCCEILNSRIGASYQVYINPEREVEKSAFGVHGISDEFLSDKPKFKTIAKDFLDFIGNDKLIIHNAKFDISFLNNELRIARLPLIKEERAVDTLIIARKKYPGSPASLDALCKRFSISTSDRTKHGALLDAQLLALVYIAMHDPTQINMNFAEEERVHGNVLAAYGIAKEDREFPLSASEEEAHKHLTLKIKDAIWNKYIN